MAIAREFHCRGWTPEQYDEVISRMDGGGERAAHGVLFHWVRLTDDGLVAVDVYESRDVADRLAQEEIGPIAGELGLAMPDIQEYDVHAFLTPR